MLVKQGTVGVEKMQRHIIRHFVWFLSRIARCGEETRQTAFATD